MINESEIQQIRANLATVNDILVVTSQNANVDRLAAALAMFLGFQKLGKKVQIATEANLTVGQAGLFGVGEVNNRFPQLKGGDMTLTLENVVIDQGPDAGKVPALEKLDWFPEGKNLKLVFHVIPGQRFEPSNVGVSYEKGGYGMIVAVGVSALENIGRIYTANKASFGQSQIVNIDNQSQNSQFGQVNIVNPTAASISEVVVEVMNGLGITMDEDIASNILVGIYHATHNLTQRTTAETFLAIGQAMQSGGKQVRTNRGPQNPPNNPRSNNQNVNRQQDRQPVNQPQSVPQSSAQPANEAPVVDTSMRDLPTEKPVQPVATRQNPFLGGQSNLGFNPVFQPQFGGASEPKEPVQNQGFDIKGFQDTQTQSAPQSAGEPSSMVAETEVVEPADEEADPTMSDSFVPAPDWLTPKVYKGGGQG